jgi:hypothetical protein
MIYEDEVPPYDPTEEKVDKNAHILTRFKPEDLELATRVNQEDYLKGLLIETLYDLYDAHNKAGAVWFNSGDDAILKTKVDLANAENRLVEVFIFIYKLLNVDTNIYVIIAIINNILISIINRDADYVQDVMADIANNYITRDMILRYNMQNSYGKKNRRKHKTNRKNGKTHNKRIKRKSHRRSNKRSNRRN